MWSWTGDTFMAYNPLSTGYWRFLSSILVYDSRTHCHWLYVIVIRRNSGSHIYHLLPLVTPLTIRATVSFNPSLPFFFQTQMANQHHPEGDWLRGNDPLLPFTAANDNQVINFDYISSEVIYRYASTVSPPFIVSVGKFLYTEALDLLRHLAVQVRKARLPLICRKLSTYLCKFTSSFPQSRRWSWIHGIAQAPLHDRHRTRCCVSFI